jgi:hypothetical protein
VQWAAAHPQGISESDEPVEMAMTDEMIEIHERIADATGEEVGA